MRPVKPSRVSQPFGDPGSYASHADKHGPAGHHTGKDYGSAWPASILNRVVRSVFAGIVVINDYNSTMGHWAGIYDPEQDETYTYWHLRLTNSDLHVGKHVRRGAPLGRVGSTGNSTAPHLHVQANPGRGFNYHAHIPPTRTKPRRSLLLPGMAPGEIGIGMPTFKPEVLEYHDEYVLNYDGQGR